VKAAYEAVKDVFPTAGCLLPWRRQLPDIDSPQMLAEYRNLANEAEAIVAARRQAA
jgi:hypothetical protein